MSKRTEEKEQLVKALDRSCDELHKLRLQADTVSLTDFSVIS